MRSKIIKCRSFLKLLIVLGTTGFFFNGCKKNNNEQSNNNTNINITAISPESGPYSTIVTITGSGFSTNIIDNIVSFNDKPAVVQTASPTQLVVVVPKAAGSGPVKVQRGSTVIIGPDFNFIYTITVSTFAGNGAAGNTDGNGSSAEFYTPIGIACDAQDNIYVGDKDNHNIRKITPAAVVSTLAGNGSSGYANGNGSSAQFFAPFGVACDAQNNIYVADLGNERIRKITPSGDVSTFAGSSTAGSTDGNGSSARFNDPIGVACDAQNNIYVADKLNNRIRKITPAAVVSTLAGSSPGFTDGSGSSAQFYAPYSVTCDASGFVYVGDIGNERVRKITALGDVSTLAGNATAGYADGNGTSAQFNDPIGVTADQEGNIYVADRLNNRIRKITASGVVSTIAGTGATGFVDGSGNTAQFFAPYNIAIDSQGNLYVTDAGNNSIRKITIE